MTIYTNSTLKVYSSEFNESISIEPYDPNELPNLITVKTSNKTTWGDIDFTLDLETATALANALLKQVEFIRES